MEANIVLGPVGNDVRNRVVIDGEDITGDIDYIKVEAGRDNVTRITVTYLMRSGEANIKVFDGTA